MDHAEHTSNAEAAQSRMAETGGGTRFDVGRQSAEAINNAARDQYITHVQSERASFLRDVAATRTKARWLVWLGLIGTLAGMGIFFWAFAGYFGAFADAFSNTGDSSSFDAVFAAFGQEIAGVNAFILGLAVATIGQVMLLVGIVMHIVATARKKRADRQLTIQPPWTLPGWESAR